MIIDYQQKLADLTVAEFANLMNDVLTKEKQICQNDYVFGLYGLANLLGVSLPTAQRIKNTGAIDDAITYAGRKMVINKQMVFDKLKGRMIK
jgi:hypothetical protein